MARSKWISFVGQQSLERPNKQDATVATSPPPPSPADAKKLGLENFGNTCYANSVLQALYFCSPFRNLLLKDVENPLPSKVPSMVTATTDGPIAPGRRKSERKTSIHAPNAEQFASTSQSGGVPIPSSPPTLHSALQSLFLHIATSPIDKGTVAPRAFIDKLKELNELFRSTMHQDAHEFLNYLLNQIVEELEEQRKDVSNAEDLSSSLHTLGSRGPPPVLTAVNSSSSVPSRPDATFVHRLFEGVLTSETRCLTCETVSSRDESFLDLSIDIEQNSSVTACLRQFSASEMLCQKNKFFCDSCCDLQEAEKRMKIKKLPNILALHLKRFKYQEDLGRYTKLSYRVAFPMELRLFNTVDDLDDADRLYNLFAIVVHIGNGPHHGHYISIIKTTRAWLLFDDDTVSPLPESDIPRYFGDSISGSAYVLYYQAVDIDLLSLGLRPPEPPAPPEERMTLASDKSPVLPGNDCPVIPPGLQVDATNGITSLVPSLLSTQLQPEKISSTTGAISISPSDLPTPQQISSDPSPVTPTSFGRQIFNTIRRAPSMPATRANANSTDGNDNRKSLADKSPRPLASPLTPFAVPESSHEIPPPVPPLPPSILATQSSSMFPNEPRKEEKAKEKEKSRSGANWFSKKRKSLKSGDKDIKQEGASPQIPLSPVILAEDLGHSHFTGRFSRTQSSSSTPKSLWPPSEDPEKNLDHRPNGHDDSHSQPSGSSSPSTTSLFVYGQGGVGSSASTSATPHHDRLWNSSVTAPSERSRASVDRDRSLDLKIPHHGGPSATSSMQTSLDYPLPPVPSPTNYLQPFSGRGNIEHEAVSTYKTQAIESDTWLLDQQSVNSFPTPPHVSRSSTLPPHPSLNITIGSNTSSDSNPAMGRHQIRKLSITTPILGFGRKDREKNKR